MHFQNTQNHCHQWLSESSIECTKFVFGRSSAPDPPGELTELHKPLADLRGPISKGREGERKGRKGAGEEGT